MRMTDGPGADIDGNTAIGSRSSGRTWRTSPGEQGLVPASSCYRKLVLVNVSRRRSRHIVAANRSCLGSCRRPRLPDRGWEYMLETRACNWAAMSGEFDSVVVRTPPGISSNNAVDFVVPHEHLHVAAGDPTHFHARQACPGGISSLSGIVHSP